MRGGFAYHRPRTVAEAVAIKRELPGARYLAGGTDLLIKMKDGKMSAAALVSLRNVPELHGIDHGERTVIGAMTPVADCLADAELGRRFPVLARALTTLGSAQIRNVATIGGNLCNAIPCADTAPPLLVLDARLRVHVAATGREEEWPVDGFITGPRETRLGPDDVVTAIVLDRAPEASRAVFLKKMRVSMDLALASVAVRLDLDGGKCHGARVAAGSVAPTPVRLTDVERALVGSTLDADVLGRAAQLARSGIAPISDVRASADYRRHVTGVFVGRAVRAILAEPSA